MSGFSWNLTIDDKDMQRDLAELILRMDDASTFYNDVGEEIQNAIDENFKNERGPDGSPWKSLADATIADREDRGFTPVTILRASGALRQDITRDEARAATSNAVTISTSLVYAAVHQFGHTFENAWGRGIEAEVPARPYAGMSESLWKDVFEIAEDYLTI